MSGKKSKDRKKRKPGPPQQRPKETLVERNTALAQLGEYLEQFGLDVIIQSPRTSMQEWIVTLWAQDDPKDRACSSARTLSSALNDTVDQLRRPLLERHGEAPATDDDDQDDGDDEIDDDDHFEQGAFMPFHHGG